MSARPTAPLARRRSRSAMDALGAESKALGLLIGVDREKIRSMPRHPHDIDLTWEELGDALRRLEGSSVAVSVVARTVPEVLLAAFKGTLGALDTAKGATLFWPVVVSDEQRSAAAQ